MDRETAIDLLDNLLGMVEDNHDSDYDAALHMGIDALKTQDMSGNMSGTHISSDCISRQAVINEMKDMYTAAEEWAQGAHDDDTKARAESCMATNVELKLRIEKLPSVQPQRWIPFETREPDAEEKEDHPEWEYVLCGNLPDDGQRILVNIKYKGHEAVQMDEYVDDGGVCYLNSGYDIGTEATAWMPLPEPYKGEPE